MLDPERRLVALFGFPCDCLGLFRFSLCETKERTRKRGTEQLARTRDTPRAKKFNRALSTFVERRTQLIIRSAGLCGPSPAHHMSLTAHRCPLITSSLSSPLHVRRSVLSGSRLAATAPRGPRCRHDTPHTPPALLSLSCSLHRGRCPPCPPACSLPATSSSFSAAPCFFFGSSYC